MSRITVRDLLMFGHYPYHQGRPSETDKTIVEEALTEFHLQDFADRYLTELSGGQRQRAMIAMVFCQRTDYVLLDEPLNNLDMYHARSLMQILRRLTDEHKRTTVVVLHDINQAAAYADYVVAMKNGQVAMQGKPNDIFTAENIKTLFDMDVNVLDYEGKTGYPPYLNPTKGRLKPDYPRFRRPCLFKAFIFIIQTAHHATDRGNAFFQRFRVLRNAHADALCGRAGNPACRCRRRNARPE